MSEEVNKGKTNDPEQERITELSDRQLDEAAAGSIPESLNTPRDTTGVWDVGDEAHPLKVDTDGDGIRR